MAIPSKGFIMTKQMTTKTRNIATMPRHLRNRIEGMLHSVKDWLDSGQPALARQIMDEAQKLIKAFKTMPQRIMDNSLVRYCEPADNGKGYLVLTTNAGVIRASSVRDFERQLKDG